MIRSVVRSIGSGLLALLVALAMLVAIEGLSSIVHPFPPGADPTDLDVCRAHVAEYPQWFLGVAAIGWGATAFVASWLATRLGTGRHPAHGIVVGALLFLAAAFNMILLPYARWFEVAIYVGLPLVVFAGVKLGSRPGAGPRGGERETDRPLDEGALEERAPE